MSKQYGGKAMLCPGFLVETVSYSPRLDLVLLSRRDSASNLIHCTSLEFHAMSQAPIIDEVSLLRALWPVLVIDVKRHDVVPLMLENIRQDHGVNASAQ